MNPELNDDKNEPDWLAIILQFLFGTLVGGGVIFYEYFRYWHKQVDGDDFGIICSLSGALVLGSIAAIFGDETWGISFRVIPNMPIRHSHASRRLFTFIIVIAALTPLIYWILSRKA